MKLIKENYFHKKAHHGIGGGGGGEKEKGGHGGRNDDVGRVEDDEGYVAIRVDGGVP